MVFSSIWLSRAFLRAQAAGEVAEVVDGERDVGIQRLADRLAVVHRLGIGEQLEVLLDAGRRSSAARWRDRRPAVRPQLSAAAWAASSASSMSSAPERAALVYALPVIGVMTSKYWPFTGGTNLPLMKLSYCGLKCDLGAGGVGVGVEHRCLPCRSEGVVTLALDQSSQRMRPIDAKVAGCRPGATT